MSEKLTKYNKIERKRNEKQDKMLKNQLTSTPKLRIIKKEWGAFGKRSAHRKIQEVSLKWVNGREVFTSRFCRWEKTEKG